MAKLFAIICAFALTNVVQLCQTQKQTGWVYEQVACLGPNVELPPNHPILKDLREQNFSNIVHSVKIEGAFILYDFVSYNSAQNGRVEYYYSPEHKCTNLLDTANRLTSIRYAGNVHDHTVDSITLYQRTYFQAGDEHAQMDRPSLFDIRSALSFVLTGSASWTLYDQPFYRGNATCVHGLSNRTAVFSPFLPLLKPSPDKIEVINSVRIGCFR